MPQNGLGGHGSDKQARLWGGYTVNRPSAAACRSAASICTTGGPFRWRTISSCWFSVTLNALSPSNATV